MNLLEELTPIFREVFNDDRIVLTPDTTADDVDGWDSLSHMNLVLALEVRYGIRFALGEIQKLRNVGQLAGLIESKRKR
jgi:acyl carrier protein